MYNQKSAKCRSVNVSYIDLMGHIMHRHHTTPDVGELYIPGFLVCNYIVAAKVVALNVWDTIEPQQKNTSYFPLYWLVKRDPCNGPPNNQGFFFISQIEMGTPTLVGPFAARRFAQRQGLTDEVEQVQHPAKMLWKVGLGGEVRNLGTQHGSLEVDKFQEEDGRGWKIYQLPRCSWQWLLVYALWWWMATTVTAGQLQYRWLDVTSCRRTCPIIS